MRKDLQRELIRGLIAAMDAGTTVDAGGVRANPTSVYVDPGLAQREWDELFGGQPQLVGLSADLPEPGTFLTIDDLPVPVLAVRGADGVFRAMINGCRHRGAVLEQRERGAARRFSCPFHGWTYRLDGALVGLPKPEHFGAVCREGLGLVELPSVEAHGLLWVHANPNATIDVDTLLGSELAAELASWKLGDLERLDGDVYDVACNWKLAMDTFGETYHFPILHRDTIALAFHGNVQDYRTFGRHHRMLLVRREIDQLRSEPEDTWDITRATLPAYWLFPNVQLLPFQDGVYLVRAYPVPGQPGRHRSHIGFYLRPGVGVARDVASLAEQRSIAELFASIIRDEDYVMSASQQRTATAAALPHVLFGRNEPALHHYHSTFREVLGMDPLPLLRDEEVGV